MFGRQSIEATIAREHARFRRELSTLPPRWQTPGCVLFAAAAAERLFRWYDARPADERRPYSLTWRPVLEAVWAYGSGDEGAYEAVSRGLGEFYLSPYSNNGQDGPDDLDQDEAAATYFAASCVVHGLVDFALLAASRATDHLDTVWAGHDDARRDREVRQELDRQSADLAQIVAAAKANQAVPPDLVAALRGLGT